MRFWLGLDQPTPPMRQAPAAQNGYTFVSE